MTSAVTLSATTITFIVAVHCVIITRKVPGNDSFVVDRVMIVIFIEKSTASLHKHPDALAVSSAASSMSSAVYFVFTTTNRSRVMVTDDPSRDCVEFCK